MITHLTLPGQVADQLFVDHTQVFQTLQNVVWESFDVMAFVLHFYLNEPKTQMSLRDSILVFLDCSGEFLLIGHFI